MQRHFLLPLLVHRHLGLAPSSVLLGRPDGSRMQRHSGACVAGAGRQVHSFLRVIPFHSGQIFDPDLFGVDPIQMGGLHFLPLRRAVAPGWSIPSTHYPAPLMLLDVRTNGGEFANLAAGRQPGGLDRRGSRRTAGGAFGGGPSRLRVLHLHVDFTAPTPALGWNGAECLSFDQSARAFDWCWRCCTTSWCRTDPLDEALSKLASYTRSHLIIGMSTHRCDVRRTRARSDVVISSLDREASGARSLGISGSTSRSESFPAAIPCTCAVGASV